jgi:hypothetical protein
MLHITADHDQWSEKPVLEFNANASTQNVSSLQIIIMMASGLKFL